MAPERRKKESSASLWDRLPLTAQAAAALITAIALLIGSLVTAGVLRIDRPTENSAAAGDPASRGTSERTDDSGGVETARAGTNTVGENGPASRGTDDGPAASTVAERDRSPRDGPSPLRGSAPPAASRPGPARSGDHPPLSPSREFPYRALVGNPQLGSVILRQAPNSASDEVTRVEAHQAIVVGEAINGWRKVRTSAGDEGWTRAENVYAIQE